MSRVIVACPKGIVTGGPEALHQLAATLNSSGIESGLWDPNVCGEEIEPAPEFACYAVDWVAGLNPKEILVVPETFGDLVPKFYPSNKIVFWWLSVDNFFASNRVPLDVLRDGYPDIIHAYQSEYARIFLAKNEFSNLIPLSDYINDEYMHESINLDNRVHAAGNTVIAINPAKGFERASKVIHELGEGKVIRLENMSRASVMDALTEAQVYLDLGEHPGADRFPREAALMNCIVLTNKRGSAGNEIDIPISSDLFKFDDFAQDFQEVIADRIKVLGSSISHFLNLQDGYRASIVSGKEKFSIEVKDLLDLISPLKKIGRVSSGEIPNSFYIFIAEIIMQRDEVIRERDVAIRERDMVVEERNLIESQIEFLKNSLSWKITAPVRRLALLVRRSH